MHIPQSNNRLHGFPKVARKAAWTAWGCLWLLPLAAVGAPRDAPPLPKNWAVLYSRMVHGLIDPQILEQMGEDPDWFLGNIPLRVSPLIPPDCFFPGTLLRSEAPDTVNVMHYDLHFQGIHESEATLEATAVVTLETLKQLRALDLDLSLLRATSVEVEVQGTWQAAPFNHTEDRLHVTLPQDVPAFGTVRVRVAYEGSPTCFSLLGDAGLLFDERGAHTFSQPWYARNWFPCVDVPWDKATASITLDLPLERTATATGVLVGDEPLGESHHRMKWSMSDPVATYLLAFYVGDFVAVEEETTELGIPIQGYTYADILEKTQFDLANTVDMVNFFSTIYPYPFPVYANTVASLGGGMEHQTNTLIGESLMRGDRSFEWVVAHEAAHQWWGDLLTPASWDHLWLNEGFATYFDLLYTEHAYGEEAFEERAAQFETGYMLVDSILANRVGLERTSLLSMPATRWWGNEIYSKGAWVLHMLRSLCRFHFMPRGTFGDTEFNAAVIQGDVLFFDTLHSYAAKHAYGNVSSSDLQNAFETSLGEELSWYFDPWLKGKGYPQIEYQYQAIVDAALHRSTFRQIQEDSALFDMPLHVLHHSPGETRHEVVRIKPQAVTTTVSEVAGTQWSLEVDPHNWLLGTFEEAAITLPVLPGVGFASPNPSQGSFLLSYTLEENEETGMGTLQIYDSRGRLVHEQNVMTGEATVELYWNGHGFLGTRVPAGIFFARLTLENQKVYATRLVVLP